MQTRGSAPLKAPLRRPYAAFKEIGVFSCDSDGIAKNVKVKGKATEAGKGVNVSADADEA